MKHLLEPGRVLCNVEARSKKHALEILSELLSAGQPGLEQGQVFDSLVCREKLGCTAMEHGVAIPHGRCPELKSSLGAFVRLSRPLDFDMLDQAPVDLLFGLLVPDDGSERHLEKIRSVACVLKDGELRRLLRQASNSRALYDLLVGYGPAQTASA